VTGGPPVETATERGCTHPLRVPAVSVVDVIAPMAYANWGAASAITNPAINTSRDLRQFMPLTCTCSKDQNRVPPACRSPESYCIRRGRTGANRSTANCAEKPKISRGSSCHGWTRHARNGKWEVEVTASGRESGAIEPRRTGTVICFRHRIYSGTQGSRAVPPYTCPFWHSEGWHYFPPQRRRPVAGDPG